MARFVKGQSGNPNGRPKKRRPNVSAFDILLDRTVTISQGGMEREHSVDEAMEFQTFQDALKGGRMAVRQVLRMIEKREAALAKLNPPTSNAVRMDIEYEAGNAEQAMLLLGIAEYEEAPPGPGYRDRRLKLATWAVQAAISRPGRRPINSQNVSDIQRLTIDPKKLKWPRGLRP